MGILVYFGSNLQALSCCCKYSPLHWVRINPQNSLFTPVWFTFTSYQWFYKLSSVVIQYIKIGGGGGVPARLSGPWDEHMNTFNFLFVCLQWCLILYIALFFLFFFFTFSCLIVCKRCIGMQRLAISQCLANRCCYLLLVIFTPQPTTLQPSLFLCFGSTIFSSLVITFPPLFFSSALLLSIFLVLTKFDKSKRWTL